MLFDTSALTGLAFRVLGVTIVLLFVVTVGFSIYSIILRFAYERRNRLWARLSEQWSDPLLAAIANPERIPDAHALVDPRHRLYFVHFVLDYSQRVRGEELETLRALANPYLGEIAGRVRHRRPEVRLRSVQTLGTLGLPTYEQPVLEALSDPTASVAIVAARALARPEYAEHAELILETLPRFSAWEHSFLAAMLAGLGPAVSPRLRDRLADPTAPDWLRTVYAIALKLQLDPRSADVAASVLETAEDLDLVAALLKLLIEFGRPEHLDAIRPLLDDRNSVIRALALKAFGSLGDASVLPLLERGIDDRDPWASATAVRAVVSIGGARSVARLSRENEAHARLFAQVSAERGP